MKTNEVSFCKTRVAGFCNGHGEDATPDDESRHARFPHLNPLPEGEEANESLREFYVNKIWIALPMAAFALSACVTINIYFPAAAAEKAADKIIDEVWQTQHSDKPVTPAAKETK